jgi:hypothetical protein
MRFRHLALLALATAANAALLLTGHAAAQTAPDTAPCASPSDTTTQPTTPPESPTTTPPPSDPPASPPAQPHTPPVTTPVAHLRLNELLADPVGKDADGEFIELHNAGTTTADTTGWSFTDGKNHTFTVPSASVPAGGVLSYPFSQTGITLTNAGGTITLREPSGTTVDTTTYPAVKEGIAWAKDSNNGWRETPTPTPGATNAFPAPTTTPPASATPPSNTDDAAPTIPTAPTQAPSTTVPTPTSELGHPLITEVLPDPAGSDEAEWIELFNPNDTPFALAGWQLDDAPGGSPVFRFGADTTIPARAALVVARATSGLALNNDGDQVRLLTAQGTEVDVLTYAKAEENRSFARMPSGDTAWTTPTPGVYPPPEDIVATTTAAEEEDENSLAMAATAPATHLTITDAREAEPGMEVTLRGTVALAPGRITATTTVLVDEQGMGILVRSSGFSSHPPAVGDQLEVTGTTSWHAYGPTLIATKDGMSDLGPGELPVTEDAEAEPHETPALVTATGRITKLSAMGLSILTDTGSELAVALARPSDKSGLKKGERVTAAGVLVAKGDPATLYAAPGGVAPVPSPEPSPDTAPNVRPTTTPAAQKQWPLLPLAGAGVAASAGAAWFLYRKYRATPPPHETAATPLMLSEVEMVPSRRESRPLEFERIF